MRRWVILLTLLLCSGCVAVEPNLIEKEDLVTDQVFYEFHLEVSYPAKKFMTPEEWAEYHILPDSQREVMYRSYKEREEIEENWENFINNCLLKFTFDC